MSSLVIFLRIARPPRSTRPDPPIPDTALFQSEQPRKGERLEVLLANRSSQPLPRAPLESRKIVRKLRVFFVSPATDLAGANDADYRMTNYEHSFNIH